MHSSLKMSAEIFKLYFGFNRSLQSFKFFFSTCRSECCKTTSYVTDACSFKPSSTCKIPPQKMSSNMYRPVRTYGFLASICEPYSYRTSSLQQLSCSSFRTSNEIRGLYKNHYFPSLDASKGFQTSCAREQETKAKKADELSEELAQPEEKLSLFKRYKKMLKEYWYVLLPVHVATSLIWFGSFYYVATCGFDIVPFLEKFGVAETIIEPFRTTSLGYIAVASALYKLATPARYMVTLGGTTVAVKYLTKYGLLKPVPSKAKIKSMIQKKFKQQEKQTKENS